MLVDRLKVGRDSLSCERTERRDVIQESDVTLYLPALESLRTLIRTSTSSMTSVPKPLKFLRPHYEEMGKIREGWNVDFKEQRVSVRDIGVAWMRLLRM